MNNTDQESIDLDNPEFQNVWRLVRFTNQSIFMTGKAGAGKSTFLRYITQHTRKRHVILAPTGIAAVNVGGVTLHSFFKLPFKPLLPDDPDFAGDRLRRRLAYNKAKVKLIKEVELIIIDEVSMVRADIIDFIDRILRTYSGNHRQPFGGKQMLFVGDIFQLEPVVTSDMREVLRRYYPNSYFFSASVFRNFAVVPIELQKVYRQRDSAFLALLERVRSGNPTSADVATLNTRYRENAYYNGSDDDGSFSMTLATRRDTVEQINMHHLAELDTPIVTYEGIVCDDFPDGSLPVPRELILKVGAQVVFVRNDRERRWVNGTLGRVTATNNKSVEVELENGERYKVEPHIWENIVYKYDEKEKKIIENVVGTYMQLPVNLAWALTIHKSQGLTFNNVVIDAQGAFSGGQTYVALSRCTSIEGITMKSRLHERDVFVSPAIIDFSRNYNNNELIESAMREAQADAAYDAASRAFNGRDMSTAVDKFAEAVMARNELTRTSALRLIRRKLSQLTAVEDENQRLRARIDDDRKKFEKLAAEYVAMGRDCLLEGYDPTAALANFNKALTLVENYAPAMFGRVETLLAYNDCKGALESLEKCRDAADEMQPEVIAAIARGLLSNELSFEATELLLSFEAKHKDVPVIYDCLAEASDKVDDEESAKAYRQQARRLRRPRKQR